MVFHRTTEGVGEVKKERKKVNVHGSCIQIRWRRTKSAEEDSDQKGT